MKAHATPTMRASAAERLGAVPSSTASASASTAASLSTQLARPEAEALWVGVGDVEAIRWQSAGNQ